MAAQGRSVNAAIPVLARFEHEFDYGTPAVQYLVADTQQSSAHTAHFNSAVYTRANALAIAIQSEVYAEVAIVNVRQPRLIVTDTLGVSMFQSSCP